MWLCQLITISPRPRLSIHSHHILRSTRPHKTSPTGYISTTPTNVRTKVLSTFCPDKSFVRFFLSSPTNFVQRPRPQGNGQQTHSHTNAHALGSVHLDSLWFMPTEVLSFFCPDKSFVHFLSGQKFCPNFCPDKSFVRFFLSSPTNFVQRPQGNGQQTHSHTNDHALGSVHLDSL